MIQVLVVDDDPMLREMMAQVLECEGYAVARAAHGAEAVRKMQDGQVPDVLLLDIVMPIMDGLAVCAWIDQYLAPHVRPQILVLSATYPGSARIPGVARILTKPFGIDAMLNAISACCPTLPAASVQPEENHILTAA